MCHLDIEQLKELIESVDMFAGALRSFGKDELGCGFKVPRHAADHR